MSDLDCRSFRGATVAVQSLCHAIVFELSPSSRRTGRTQTSMSSYRSPYISFHVFTWNRPKNELRPV